MLDNRTLNRFAVTAAALAAAAGLPTLLPAQDLPFPTTTWPTATPESQGLNGATLDSEVGALPFPGNFGPLVVIANGYLVYSKDFPANASIGGIDTPKELFSCSKVVTGMVAAQLAQSGQLAGLNAAIDNSVPGAWGAYPGDSSAIDFLSMTADYGLTPYKPAGGQYAYNNNGIDFLGEHLGQAILGLAADRMNLAVDQTLFATLGRQDALSFNGQWGGWFGGLRVSARDAARLGYLMARGGTWQGARVLDPQLPDGFDDPSIPSSASRYFDAGNPNQDDQFNQQHITDLLAGTWGLGTWRVGAARADGSFDAYAAEGFRGKRILVMPRGSFPDPQLEVVLVTLPSLSNEGPPTVDYRDLLLRSALSYTPHPDETPVAFIAAFDDGAMTPLQPRLGAPYVRSGRLILDGEQRLLVPGGTPDDGHALLRLQTGLPQDGWIGITGRAASTLHDYDQAGGTQFLVRVRREPNGTRVRAEVVAPGAGQATPFTGAWLSENGAAALTVRVSFTGNTLDCRINGRRALGPAGYSGVQTPAGGGHLSVRSMVPASASATPIEIDYMLLRDANGAAGLTGTDLSGEHYMALFLPDNLPFLNPAAFFQEIDGFRYDLPFFGTILPFVWPTLRGLDLDHFIVSSHGAVFPLSPNAQLVFEYAGQRNGVQLR